MTIIAYILWLNFSFSDLNSKGCPCKRKGGQRGQSSVAKTEIGSNVSQQTSSSSSDDDDDDEGIMAKYITLSVIRFQEQSVQLLIFWLF